MSVEVVSNLFANYREVEPEESEFITLVADITHKCNMNCSNCYIPNRTIPDMDIQRFENLVKRLKRRTEIRLVGAEPTMRADLERFIQIVREYGHRPILLTNGLRLVDKNYLSSLKAAGLRTVYLSMNGADNDNWYLQTDKRRCATEKMTALRNLNDLNFKIGLGCILQRGANEGAPERLFEIVRSIGNQDIVIRFRNVGQLGRYSQDAATAYSFSEIKAIIAKAAGVSLQHIQENGFSGPHDRKTIFFYAPLSSSKQDRILLSITNWNARDPDPNPSPEELRRGRITQDFRIAPYFEHIKMNEFFY